MQQILLAIILALLLAVRAYGQSTEERLKQIDLEKQIQNERFERAREMSDAAKLRYQQLVAEENALKEKTKVEPQAKSK